MTNTRSAISSAGLDERTDHRSCVEHHRTTARGRRTTRAAGLGAAAPRAVPIHARPTPTPVTRHHRASEAAVCRRPTRRYRLRRTGLAVAVTGAMALLAAPIWGHPQAVTATPVAVAVSHRTYVVQAGDTIASIARQLEPGRDQRQIVDDLRAQLGGAPLRPGMTLQLP